MRLYYNTVNDFLRHSLDVLMLANVFSGFRLVGGTSLSLQLGHRLSIDLDLFSDATYGHIDFEAIDHFIETSFPCHDHLANLAPALGKSYTIGIDSEHAVKLDVFYTDPFIRPALIVDNIRLAAIDDIIAMKIDVVQRGGRKKDFWDLHELLPKYSVSAMLDLHKERYEYAHEREIILRNLTDFRLADEDFDPVCLRGKYWEFIKEDIEDAVAHYQM